MGAPRADFAADETRKQKRKREKREKESRELGAQRRNSCDSQMLELLCTICAQPGTGYPRNLGLFPPDETKLWKIVLCWQMENGDGIGTAEF